MTTTDYLRRFGREDAHQLIGCTRSRLERRTLALSTKHTPNRRASLFTRLRKWWGKYIDAKVEREMNK